MNSGLTIWDCYIAHLGLPISVYKEGLIYDIAVGVPKACNCGRIVITILQRCYQPSLSTVTVEMARTQDIDMNTQINPTPNWYG